MAKGQTFNGQQVEIDGESFEDCQFQSCTLTYSGGPIRGRSCMFNDCKWRFVGAANATTVFLREMYAAGDLPVRDAIESLMTFVLGGLRPPDVRGVFENVSLPDDIVQLDDLVGSRGRIERQHIAYSGGQLRFRDTDFVSCTLWLAGEARQTVLTLRSVHAAGDRLMVRSWVRAVRGQPEPSGQSGLHLVEAASGLVPQSRYRFSRERENLDALQTRIESFLGDRFEVHRRRMENARRSGDTVFVPHQLVEIHERLEISKQLLRRTPPSLDLVRWAECVKLLELVDKAQREPWWNIVKHELREPDDFAHLYLVLHWLDTLRSLGHEVEVVPAQARRAADLLLDPGKPTEVPAELKAPRALRRTSHDIGADDAAAIVEHAYRKAASGRNRQIGERPSLLCIGGFYQNKDNMRFVGEAARELLRRKKPRQLAGIVVMTLQVTVDKPRLEGTGVFAATGETSFRSSIKFELAENPAYEGSLPVHVRASEVGDAALQEFTAR